MTPKFIMFLAFVFVGCTLVSRALEGAYFSPTDVVILNSLTVFRTYNVFGLFSIPALNLNFFTIGIPKLIQWDYPFFGGGYEIFKYFMYVFSTGAVWGFFIVFSVVLSRLWGRA